MIRLFTQFRASIISIRTIRKKANSKGMMPKLRARLTRWRRVSTATVVSSLKTSKVIKIKTPIVASVLAMGVLAIMDMIEFFKVEIIEIPRC